MKYKWLNRAESDKLILFFNGWGCDEYPFQYLQGEDYNVLMFNDYKELFVSDEVLDVIPTYQQIHVVAWSFGVWVAQGLLSPLKHLMQSAIAINGTAQPISIKYGIPEPIALGTLTGLTTGSLEKFQRRMLKTTEGWQQFEAIKPRRDLEEVKNELFLLLQHFKVQKPTEGFFDCALIGSDDLIMPSKNQKAYWNSRSLMIELDQPHFCFLDFNSWGDIIKYYPANN